MSFWELQMLKLDIDYVTKKVTNFLLSLQKPYEIRLSPGKHGIHVRSDCPGCPRTGDCYSCYLFMQDDRKRLELNRSQKQRGLCHNILNDYKNGKKAGTWQTIETEQDADRFLRCFTGFY